MLAQTTQPVIQIIHDHDFTNWTPGEWGVFLGMIGAFITGPVWLLLSRIADLRRQVEKNTAKTDEATTQVAVASQTATDAKNIGIRNVDRVVAVATAASPPGARFDSLTGAPLAAAAPLPLSPALSGSYPLPMYGHGTNVSGTTIPAV